MAEKKITRTFSTTTIQAVEIIEEEGMFCHNPLNDITVPGKLDIKEAVSALIQEYGDGNYFVRNLIHNDEIRYMSVEDFYNNSKVLSK